MLACKILQVFVLGLAFQMHEHTTDKMNHDPLRGLQVSKAGSFFHSSHDLFICLRDVERSRVGS